MSPSTGTRRATRCSCSSRTSPPATGTRSRRRGLRRSMSSITPSPTRRPGSRQTYTSILEGDPMSETITYSVPGMSCGHCRAAITAEVSAVDGVESVDVDLDTKLVCITGANLDDTTLVAAIDEAGYEAARA